MANIVLQASATGTGTLTIAAPSTNSNLTFTLPNEGGQLAVGGGFASGTVMLFGQTAAPTGWTKDTANYNNSSLRVVTGTAGNGGSVDFTTAFASQTPAGSVSVDASGLSAGATTLTTTQIPSHSHTYSIGYDSGTTARAKSGANSGDTNGSTSGAGGGSSHYPLNCTGSATATFTGTDHQPSSQIR